MYKKNCKIKILIWQKKIWYTQHAYTACYILACIMFYIQSYTHIKHTSICIHARTNNTRLRSRHAPLARDWTFPSLSLLNKITNIWCSSIHEQLSLLSLKKNIHESVKRRWHVDILSLFPQVHVHPAMSARALRAMPSENVFFSSIAHSAFMPLDHSSR
jgi:hypothetical protein